MWQATMTFIPIGDAVTHAHHMPANKWLFINDPEDKVRPISGRRVQLQDRKVLFGK
jgi:hypothetical protein